MTRKKLTEKICPQCNEKKTREDFYPKVTKYTTKNGVMENTSIRPKCKECMNKNSREMWKKSEEYRGNAYKASRKNLLKKYGLTEEEYQINCAIQGNSCKICGLPQDKLVVDHCHKTGVVRGFLCKRCNSALGLFKDNSAIVSSALEYLNDFDSRHRNKP